MCKVFGFDVEALAVDHPFVQTKRLCAALPASTRGRFSSDASEWQNFCHRLAPTRVCGKGLRAAAMTFGSAGRAALMLANRRNPSFGVMRPHNTSRAVMSSSAL